MYTHTLSVFTSPTFDTPLPRWNGEANSTLLIDIDEEDGLGDLIFCSRYFPLLCRRGITPVFEIRGTESKWELFQLLQKQSWWEQNICRIGNETHWTSLAHLIRVFDRTPDLKRPPAPLFEVDRDLQFENELRGQANGKKLVGFCGLSGLSRPHLNRSMTQKQIEGFVNEVSSQIQLVNLYPERLDLPGVLNPDVSSIERLAAATAVLDLVITVDTFQAHLAGCLQKPTWMLLGRSPHWFWNHEDDPTRTSWYPSLRLSRSPSADLDDGISNVVERLKTSQ